MAKFYWLRLQRDFFKRHDIQVIEAMDNGKDYILFYLKLLVESVDHEGCLRFSETIPYNESMLSAVTRTNVDIVRSALKVFQTLGMIEVLDDETIYMTEVSGMLGSAQQDEHTRESTRRRVQAFRERQKEKKIEEKRYSNVTCNGEIEIEKELEIENIDNDKSLSMSKVDYQKVVNLYNSICKSYPRVTKLSDARKKAIKARMNTYTLDDFERMFTLAEESDFLKGKNKHDWQANFDWLIKDANFSKVLDGNYKNKRSASVIDSWGVDE